MESIYNATLHGPNGITKNNLTSSGLKPQRTILQWLALKEEDHSSLYVTSCSRISRKKKGENQYQILRYHNKDNQVIPGWKGFFYEITKETADTHIVRYLPTIC